MAEKIDEYFTATIAAVPAGEGRGGVDRNAPILPSSALTVQDVLDLFDAQLGSRHLDLAARWLRARGEGFYTIGSVRPRGQRRRRGRAAAHGSRAAALPFGRVLPGRGRARWTAATRCATCCSASAPRPTSRSAAAGTRCSAASTSTSSRRPRRSPRTCRAPSGWRSRSGGPPSWASTPPWPATPSSCAASATRRRTTRPRPARINTATHAAYQGLPLPLLFVCEDNGIGISVRPRRAGSPRTRQPRRARLLRRRRRRPGRHLRRRRRRRAVGAQAPQPGVPAPAHGAADGPRRLGRGGGLPHAPARSPPTRPRPAASARAKLLISHAGLPHPGRVVDRYEAKRAEVLGDRRARSPNCPKLDSAAQVMRPLLDGLADAIGGRATACDGDGGRRRGAADPRAVDQPRARRRAGRVPGSIWCSARTWRARAASTGSPADCAEAVRPGAGLRHPARRAGHPRTGAGRRAGRAAAGSRRSSTWPTCTTPPTRSAARRATLQFFSDGQYRNPMVVRVAGLGYQKGFGGHFHNDNAVAALRDIPGLVIASPVAARRRGRHAAHLRRAAASRRPRLRLPGTDRAVPRAGPARAGDDGWLAPLPGRCGTCRSGGARTYGDGTDLTIVTFGNGVPMSLRVARRLANDGIAARVLDLRWLAPLARRRHAARGHGDRPGAGRRRDPAHRRRRPRACSPRWSTPASPARLARVASEDSFIPLGDAALNVLLSEEQIEAAALKLTT